MKAVVIINETHKLLPIQTEQIAATFEEWRLMHVPEQGWTKEQIGRVADELVEGPDAIVFVSPVPLLLGYVAPFGRVWVFHNDKRVAREVKDQQGNTKIIHTLSPEGWELIQVA